MQLVNDVINAITAGDLSFSEIAELFNLTITEVNEIYDYMIDMETEMEYNDSMDGDFDSAMASAGFGTDEDYGYFGD